MLTKLAIWRNVTKYKTEGSNLNLIKGTELTQENINLQEKLNEYPRISARKNGLDNSKSTFNRITKRDLK